MSVSLRKKENFIIIDIHSNEINKDIVCILRNTLHKLINENKIKIAINLSIVNSIDSSLLGCLVIAQKKYLKVGGDIRLFGIQPDVLMVLYIIQLDKYLNLYNNEFDALDNRNNLVKRKLNIV